MSFWFEGPIYCDKQQLQSVEAPPETTCLDEDRSKPGVGRHTFEVSQAPPAKQQRLDFNRTVSQGQINKAIARYVVENVQPVSTVESPAFRQLFSMITCLGGTRQMGRKTFSNYLDKEYSKMESELKTTFEGLDYIATTADIWSVHNRSFLGMTAHWINTATLQRQKAALACKRIKGRHTYDVIAAEIDHIHSLYGY